MWGWILYLHVWKVARVKEINIIRSDLWISAFLIVPSMLMALKQRLSAWHSPSCLLQEIKQILKAKEIIPPKTMPCKPLSAELYLYKDVCRSKSTQTYLLSFPPIHQFVLAGSLRLSTEANQCTWLPKCPLLAERTHFLSSYHLFFFERLNLIVDHTCLRGTDIKIWVEPCSCALGVCKAPYFWMPVS